MNDEKMLNFLSDSYSRGIISSTVKEEHSAQELTTTLNIPPATVYRKLRSLEEAGIIQHVKTVVNSSGNEEKFYRCNVKKFSAIFKNGRLSIELEKKDLSDRIVRLWEILSDENLTRKEPAREDVRVKGKTKHKRKKALS